MRYLVFDIECCDGAHICEFGYVIANENFEIIEKDVMLINPEMPFNLKGRGNSDDITLFYSNEEYYSSPTFPSKYKFIKSLLETPDQIVIGHAISNDIRFLRTACKRYDLSTSMKFNFIDSQKVYEEFTNKKSGTSLENAETALNLPKPEYHHRSDEDAKLTLGLIQAVCEAMEANINELMQLCTTACGKSENLFYTYDGTSLKKMLELMGTNPNLLSNNKKAKCFKEFVAEVEAEGEVIDSELNGTVFCFSKFYEKYCTKETFVFLQQMYNHGCRYTSIVCDCDYYVPSDQELMKDSSDTNTRYHAAAVSNRKIPIKIITMEEAMLMFGLTPAKLRSMDMPTLPKKKKKNAEAVYYSAGNAVSTVGDRLKAKGIDLLALFS